MKKKALIIICIILFSVHSGIARKFKPIDDFSKIRKWRLLPDRGCKAKLNLIKEDDRRCLLVDYDFNTGNWIQVYKFIDIDFTKVKDLKFTYKAEGNLNKIEIKIEDKDGSIFGVEMDINTFSEDWDENIIPIMELEHKWGGDNKLDLKNIEKIYIEIVKKEGGEGELYISEFSYATEEEKIEKEKKEDLKDEKRIIFIDSMDSKKNWGLQKDKGVAAFVKISKGIVGRAIRINYNLEEGNWFQILRESMMNLTGMNEIEFYYKGGDAVNNIEIKIQDSDGSIYGYILNAASNVPDWKKVVIPFSSLKYFWGGDERLALANIKSISIAVSKNRGGKGYILFDDFKIKAEKGLKTDVYTTSADIDDFEEVNLQSKYLALKEDNSIIIINSSRLYVKNGNYSMEILYQLSTDKTTPSSVSALYQSDKSLDWSNVEKLHIWVKGDGSGNIFRISLLDLEGNPYIYEDKDVLFSHNWKKISMPLHAFKIPKWWTIKGKKSVKYKTIKTVKGFEFSVVGRIVDDSQGKIYIDHFYSTGKKLLPINVVPTETLQVVKLQRPQGNVDIKGRAYAEYKNSEEENHRVLANANLGFDAALKKFQFYLELHLHDQEFGEGVYVDNNKNLNTDYPEIEASSIRISAIRPIDYIHNITAGNIWVDYSDYTISQWGWGFKGIQGEGAVNFLNFNMFLIKHKYDSITYGGFLNYAQEGYVGRIIYVQYKQTGKRETSGIVNSDGEIISDSNGVVGAAGTIIETVETLNDQVITLELGKRFSDNFTLRFLTGIDIYKKIGILNQEDIQNTVFSHYLEEEIDQKGYTYKTEVELNNFPLQGGRIYFHVRVSDKNFKPYYRKEPEWFDESKSDCKGFNLQLRQSVLGFVPSFTYDFIRRKSNNKYYSRFYQWGIDKYNYYSMDLFFFQEFKNRNDQWDKRDIHGLFSETSKVNEKIKSHIFKIVYHFSPSVELLQELRFEYITKPEEDNKEYNAIVYYIQFLYYLSSTTKLTFNARATKYGKMEWEPHAYPYDDNYYKLLFEVSF